MTNENLKPLDELIQQLVELRSQLQMEPSEYPVRIWGCSSDMVGSSCIGVKPVRFVDYGEDRGEGTWSAEQRYWGICLKEDDGNRTL